MKKSYLLTALFFVCLALAQGKRQEFDNLVESEMKSSSKLSAMAINPNTQNYDVTYHKLEFTVNPAVFSITGKVTTTFTALSDMSTVTFDFSKITNTSSPNYANRIIVSSVKQNGVNLSFVHNNNNELVITLQNNLPTGNSTAVEIKYAGAPANSGFGSFVNNTHNGTPILWTLSEPFGAMDWWPCKQDLNDKINNIDVYITAPSQYKAVSNGIEPSAPIIIGAYKTTHFQHTYPIPAYLICMAVTNYSVYNQVAGSGTNTFPIVNYVYPENLNSFIPQMDQTPLIMNLYEDLFEIYPFHNEKYGHAQFGWGGGMEHTTVSFMANFDRQLIAHELGHQWFGDKITCGTWKDIWLNEGFATYLATLVIENFDGADAFVQEKSEMIDNITSQPAGNVYLNDTQALNVNRIFSGRLSYNKGAMVLEMLRFKLGDALFFQGMKSYLADPNLAFKYAVTTDFKSHMETAYGSSLTEFFNDWIYNQGYPSYEFLSESLGSNLFQFTLNQTQSDGSVIFFEMPIQIMVYGTGGEQLSFILDNTSNGQQFIRTIPFPVADIVFDPNKHIISANNSITLGLNNYDANNSLKIFPNPVTDELNIRIPNMETINNVIIYNLMGQKIIEKNTQTISVSELSTGVYTISVETSEGIFHKKFIKK